MKQLIAEGLIPFNGSSSMWLCMLLLCVLLPYLLGSVDFAILLTKKKGDIRTMGSGNAGATNMMRVYGKKAAVAVFLLDALKGALSALLGLVLFPLDWVAYVSVLFCMLGHAFPVWYGFQGGKCVSCAAGAVLVLNPIVFVIVIILYFFIAFFFKYISLASMIASVLFAILNMKIPFYSPFLSFPTKSIVSFLIPVLILILHRKNLVRIIAGEEPKVFTLKKDNDESGLLP